jgi:hypothetical protein
MMNDGSCTRILTEQTSALREAKPTQKTTYGAIPFISNAQKRQLHRDRK